MNKLITCVFLLFLFVVKSKVIPVTIVREFKGCKGWETLPFHLDTIKVNISAKGSTVFYGKIVVDEDIDHLSSMTIKVDKCTIDHTCEYYSTYKFSNLCETIMKNLDGLFGIFFRTTPTISCPIKKGTYELIPSVTKVNDASNNVYYKFSVKYFEDNVVVACIKGSLGRVMLRIRS